MLCTGIGNGCLSRRSRLFRHPGLWYTSAFVVRLWLLSASVASSRSRFRHPGLCPLFVPHFVMDTPFFGMFGLVPPSLPTPRRAPMGAQPPALAAGHRFAHHSGTQGGEAGRGAAAAGGWAGAWRRRALGARAAVGGAGGARLRQGDSNWRSESPRPGAILNTKQVATGLHYPNCLGIGIGIVVSSSIWSNVRRRGAPSVDRPE